MKKHFKHIVRCDKKSNKAFVNARGHMLVVLLMALAVTGWIDVFKDQINEINISYYEQIFRV